MIAPKKPLNPLPHKIEKKKPWSRYGIIPGFVKAIISKTLMSPCHMHMIILWNLCLINCRYKQASSAEMERREKEKKSNKWRQLGMRKIMPTLIYCSLSSRKQSEERERQRVYFLQFCDVAEVISIDKMI